MAEITVRVVRDSVPALELRMRSTDTVLDLKTKICEAGGIPVDQQIIVFRGKPVQDHKPCAGLSTVFQVQRLRGSLV